MLSPQQEERLTSQGDCVEHWHSADRIRTHDDVLTLQALTSPLGFTTDFVMDYKQDYVLMDTTLASLTVTLPKSANGREIEVVKNSPANVLKIVPHSTDLILDKTELRVYNYGTALRFKAIPGGWCII